jgi:hypothetical protein
MARRLTANGLAYVRAHNWQTRKQEYLALTERLAGRVSATQECGAVC